MKVNLIKRDVRRREIILSAKRESHYKNGAKMRQSTGLVDYPGSFSDWLPVYDARARQDFIFF